MTFIMNDNKKFHSIINKSEEQVPRILSKRSKNIQCISK